MSGVLAFLLGLFLLHKTFFAKKKRALLTSSATARFSKKARDDPYSKVPFVRGGGGGGLLLEEATGGGLGRDGDAVDVIIVGAGVAGAALACTLAKDGWRVHVIERDLSEQDRIVGELLQPGGYLKLLELDLADCVEEIDAQRIMGYALYKDRKSAHLSYTLRNFTSDVPGRGFHNGRFIQRMREKAATLSKYASKSDDSTGSHKHPTGGAVTEGTSGKMKNR